ncbi:MAG TPA: type II CAAX endopeptidase family protein [Bacteroidota bacterium]|nr:type II CAAX endopeptidase family protein [Bacteroidota bacterium]
MSYAVFYVLAAGICGWLVKHYPQPLLGSAGFTEDAWYALLFKIGLLLVVPAAWFLRQGYRITDLLPTWKFEFRSVVSIVLSFLAGLSLNLGRIHFITEAAGGFSTADLIARFGIGIVLPLFMAGIPEEFVYRGILQTRLELQFGRIFAILTTALLFTCWHLPTRFLLARGVEGSAGDFGSVLMGTGIPVFVVGLIFGLSWDRYRSILPLIAAHWGIDIIPQIVGFLGVRY